MPCGEINYWEKIEEMDNIYFETGCCLCYQYVGKANLIHFSYTYFGTRTYAGYTKNHINVDSVYYAL